MPPYDSVGTEARVDPQLDSYDFGRLIYLGILCLVLVGYFLTSGRKVMAHALRLMLLWALIFVGVLAAYGLWQDVSPELAPRQISVAQGVIEVPKRRDGHYYLNLKVNGEPVEFVVDTGASTIVIGKEAAAKLGLNPPLGAYSGTARTANGIVRTAPVKLDTLQLGDILDRNVRAYVTDGDMDGSLLGMDYLSRFSKIEIAGDKMVLRR